MKSKTTAALKQTEPQLEVDTLLQYLTEYNTSIPKRTLLTILCVARIQRVARKMSAATSKLAETFGLSRGDLYTLFVLQRAPEHAARPADLAKALTMTAGGMTKRLDRLVQAGFVQRERHAKDGRGVVISLTKIGVRTVESARATEGRITSGDLTTDELDTLGDLLWRFDKKFP